jgi:superfamily II DNA or RNA helicase
VTSHVLNEGVDVPEVRIAIILSGTGSAREYIQRLGRVLRKGSQQNKLAILYEIVAEDTSEEQTSKRRRTQESEPEKTKQLELLPTAISYTSKPKPIPKAAETSKNWHPPE